VSKKVSIGGKIKTVNALKTILVESIILQPETDTMNSIYFTKFGHYESAD
jgi:hypothetical protein